jgi:hypothetical protein
MNSGLKQAALTTLLLSCLPGLGCKKNTGPAVDNSKTTQKSPERDPQPFAPTSPDSGEVIHARPKIGSYLFKGNGTTHIEISRAFKEAQQLFDQGLAQLHGHWYYEAERSFRQVLATEPDCAMAHWGVAMANVHNPDRASEATAEAVYHQHRATKWEQLWIDGLKDFYEVTPAMAKANHARIWFDPKLGQPPLPTPKRAFSKSLKERSQDLTAHYSRLMATRPGDVEALAFHVNQHWFNRRNNFTCLAKEDLDTQLSAIFAKRPHHPAHLYRMLLWHTDNPGKALASAQAVAAIAPANGNMWYWAAQIFTALKQPAQAISHLERGLDADHTHMQRFYMMPYEVFHYGRTLETTIATLTQVGRSSDALQLVRHALTMPRHPKFNQARERYSLAGRILAAANDTCQALGLLAELKQLTANGNLDVDPKHLRPKAGAPQLARTSFWQPQTRRNWVLKTANHDSVDFQRDFSGKPALVVLYQGFG